MGQGFITRRGNGIGEKYEQVVNYTMLYHEGNEYTDVTGGFQWVNVDSNYKPVLSFSRQSAYLQCNQTGSGVGAITTVNSFNMAEYSKIRIVVSAKFNSASWVTLHLSLLKSVSVGTNRRNVLLGTNATVSKKTYLYDISDIYSDSEHAWYPYIAFPSVNIDFTGYIYLYSMILFKSDLASIPTLCEKAGVTSTYATVDALVSDSEVISKILSSKKAVEFMISQCTGDFMAAAIQNSTFLTTLTSSPYKEKVYANEHWAEFLAMGA